MVLLGQLNPRFVPSGHCYYRRLLASAQTTGKERSSKLGIAMATKSWQNHS